MQSDVEKTRILHQESTNPVRETRCPTNSRFIFVFFSIVALWLAVGIQASFREPTNKFDDLIIRGNGNLFQLYQHVKLAAACLNPPRETFDRIFLFSLFLGSISMFNCIHLIRTFTRSFVWISLILFVISLIIEIAGIVIFSLSSLNGIIIMCAIFCLSVCVVYTIVILYCMQNVGLTVISKLVKNSARAITGSPIMIFFAFAVAILDITAIVFGINALKFILSSDDHIFWITSFSLINVSGTIFINNCLILFAMAVISEYTVNWVWTKEKNEISSKMFLRSYIRIFRNHFGTIAMQSTVIMPCIYTCARALKYRYRSGQARKFLHKFFISIAKVLLTFGVGHTASIHTSIYGSNFVKATKKTLKLVLSNPLLYIATVELLRVISLIGLIGNTIVMFFTAYTIVRIEHIPVHNMPLPFFWGFYFPVLVYSILMLGAGRALLMNEIIILKAEKHMKENPEVAC